MTDDPRLAALAEALTDVQGGAYASWLKRTPAILAKLPPDWCGHDAEITELQMEFGDACLTMDEQRAEIARLRERLASADAAVDAAAGWRYWLGHDELTERVNRALDDRAALAGGSE